MDELLNFLVDDDERPHTLAVIRGHLLYWGMHAQGAPAAHAIGFSTPGQFRRALCRRYLNKAAQTFDGSPWQRAEHLEQAVRAFETRRWPRCRSELAAPGRLSEVDRILFDVLKLGESFPRTARGLFNILDD